MSRYFIKQRAPLPPRAPLKRSTSMHDPESPISDEIYGMPQSASSTAPVILLERWRKRRMQGNANIPNIDPRVENDDAMIPDVLNLMSFDDDPVDSSDCIDNTMIAGTKISREGIRTNIEDIMKNHEGNMEILEAIWANRSNVRLLLNSATPKEKQVALLWACFNRRREFLPMLVPGADLDFYIEEGLTPLHLAALSASPDCVAFLLNAGAVSSKPRSLTPLHCAALGNSIECIKLLLNAGDSVNFNPNDYSIFQETEDSPLHSAILANAPDCVALLLYAGADATAIGADGLSALHLAALLGYTECLKNILRNKGSLNVNTKTPDQYANTALHLAAEHEFSETVQILLSHGADPDIKNLKSETALIIAAKKQSINCIENLIPRCDVNIADANGRTALHAVVGRVERATEAVKILCKAPGINLNLSDKYGQTALHVAASNGLPIPTAVLIRQGADMTAKTKRGATALSLVLRKAPEASYAIEEVLNSAIRISMESNKDEGVDLKLDFKPLLQKDNCIEISLLTTFIAEGQKALLLHPLCKAFLYLKWQTIRKFYALRLLLSILFVLFLSMYALFYLTNSSTHDFMILPISETFLQNLKYVINCGLLFFTLLEILRKAFGLVSVISAPTVLSVLSALKNYFCQIDNIFEWLTLISVFLISNLIWQSKQQWQEHLGAFAVLCGWINLMMMVGQLPLFGAYVSMYTCVLREFSKLFLAYICLLIGFAISFSLIFRKAKEFSNPLIAFVKVLVMMTGELEFKDLLIDKEDISATNKTMIDEVKYLPFTTPIIFVVCLLLLTVALMNLLVGIAVHDIKGLRTSADLSKLENQAILVSFVETALSDCHSSLLFSTRLKSHIHTTQIKSKSTLLRIRNKDQRSDTCRLPKEIVNEAYEIAKRCNNIDKRRALSWKNKSTPVRFGSNTKPKESKSMSLPRTPRRRRTIYVQLDDKTQNQGSMELDNETLASLTQICEENQAALSEMRGMLRHIIERNPSLATRSQE